MLPETSKNVSLFPSFDDLPNPPIDEIVEPKSFRNILVRAFCYTVMIPLCVLFFFLEQQIQGVSDTTDASQLAVAKTVAAETNDFVNHTADLIRIATIALDESDDSSAVRRIFTGVFRQKPDLHVLSWITADGKTVTVGPFKEDGLHWELDNKEKKNLQRLSEDAFPEMVLQGDDTDDIDRHRFLSLTFNPTANSHKDEIGRAHV